MSKLTNQDIENFNLLYQDFTKDRVHNIISMACRDNNLNLLHYFFLHHPLAPSNTYPQMAIDIHLNNDEFFLKACRNGHVDIVSFLAHSPLIKEHANIHSLDNIAFLGAIKNGHMLVAQYIIFETDIKWNKKIKDYLIRNAPQYVEDVEKIFFTKKLNKDLADNKNDKKKTNKI